MCGPPGGESSGGRGLDRDQLRAILHQFADGAAERGDSAVCRRRDAHLHLHRLHHQQHGAAHVEGARWEGDALGFRLDGAACRARVLREGDALFVILDGETHELRHRDPRAPSGAAEGAGGRVIAPMPGRVLQVLVAPGDHVARGAVLLVMEAMKVQMRITAPAEGIVTAIRCAVGELVEDGAELVTIESAPSA